VDYKQAHVRENAKYDAWQRDILSRFGVHLGMNEMHTLLLKARNRLHTSGFWFIFIFLSPHFYDNSLRSMYFTDILDVSSPEKDLRYQIVSGFDN